LYVENCHDLRSGSCHNFKNILIYQMTYIRLFILLTANIIPFLICFGQDSIKIESLISIETEGQHNLAALNRNFDCINCITGKIGDNPLHHLGIYTGINHLLIFDNRYSLETGLYLEERSNSGGNNTLSNLVIFPKILLTVGDSITKNGSVEYFIKGGDLWNEEIGDFLRIYNIDYQGLIGELRVKKLTFGFMTIGDLSKNIGLDLHQLYKFSTEYKSRRFSNKASITINELFTQPVGLHPTKSDINVANYAKYNLSKNTTVEGQFEMRLNEKSAPSYASGVRVNYTHKQFKIKSVLRYYSGTFNLGYNGDGPRYLWAGGGYIGPQLYPLKNFYRDFSQWAFYTHETNNDVLTVEFTLSWNTKVYKKLSGFCDFDINYIYDLDNRNGKIFPIYNTGFRFNFLAVFNGRISITNKHMELRRYYQTMSISKMPFLSLGTHIKLDKLKLKTKFLKS